MKYLECIELLNHALQLLRDGQREQVPVVRLSEVQTLVTRVMLRMTEQQLVIVRCNDVVGAIDIAQRRKDMLNLTQRMRDIIVSGLHDCLDTVCDVAWDYYTEHDVPISDDTIPLLTSLVTNHFNRGA